MLMAEWEVRSAEAQVVLELDADLPRLKGDPVQMQQVILNLVRNGLDSIRQAESGVHQLKIQTFRGGEGDLVVAIHDTGVGLSDGIRDRLFEPFFTTKASGTGLGLAISRSIVEGYGGRLWAEDRRPVGASFFVSIPSAEGDSDE